MFMAGGGNENKKPVSSLFVLLVDFGRLNVEKTPPPPPSPSQNLLDEKDKFGEGVPKSRGGE